ncbi:MAG: flagellar basal-body rod protein FlgF [Alphaproteobacteria bacterium]|nr:flagellar basal-body rod protein FlgF [Alphaproteobacteria bacterium]
MENTIYIGLSRLSALQEHMSLIANNIANINTPGYKANKILFSEYLDKPKGMKETISMVLDYGNYRVKDNGPIKRTGNQLDIALEGNGYLGVQGPNNQRFYTRNGSFSLNAQNQLVTQQGYPVLDAGGQPIVFAEGVSDIVIDESGSIGTKDGTIGALMVEEFDNINTLTPVGNSLYKTDETGKPSPKTKVLQGAIEGSNTQGVLEMTDMIDVSRNYQSVARMLQAEHDRVRATIRSLTGNS